MARNNPDWGKHLIASVGKNIDFRRTALGLSAQAVADRTAELGHPISRSTVAGISSTNRASKLSVADWLVIAAALDCAPIDLLIGGTPGGEVEVIPGRVMPAARARGWVDGTIAPPWGHAGTPWASLSFVLGEYIGAIQDAAISRAERDDLEETGASRADLHAADRRLARSVERIEATGALGAKVAAAIGLEWQPVENLGAFTRGISLFDGIEDGED
ncbi:hypothetical protein [Corynebacterium pseudopelargi]|nr:hypothetical protein [Corynebacterium pseudopelargi]